MLTDPCTKLARFAKGSADQELVRSRATQTMTGKTIEWNSNIFHNFPVGAKLTYNYTVYVSAGTYYAIDRDGNTISNVSFSALMAKLDSAISNGGGSIFIKGGTFNVATNVSFANPVFIVGSGPGITILNRTSNKLESTVLLNGPGSVLSNLTIDGNYAVCGNTGGSEVYCNANNIRLIDLEIKNFGYAAVGFWDQSGIVINRCRLTGLATTVSPVKSEMGIWSGTAATECKILNSTITGVYYNAVFACGTTFISNCYFKANAVDPGGQIIGAGPNRAVITIVQDCMFDAGGLAASAIEMDHGEYILIGNKISNQAHYGIVTNSAHIIGPSVISLNVVKNSGTAGSSYGGIQIAGAQHYFTIAGNICYDDQDIHTQEYGIVIDTTANHFVLLGNICYNNRTNQILDSSTGTDKVVRDNIRAIVRGAAIATSSDLVPQTYRRYRTGMSIATVRNTR